MLMTITVDIDAEESGYTEDQIRDDAVIFARKLIVNGAKNEGIGLTLREASCAYYPLNKLPSEIKNTVNRMLEGWHTYSEILDYLKSSGYTVSHSRLARYASDYLERRRTP